MKDRDKVKDTDKKKGERVLTEAEKKRSELFNEKIKELEGEGYTKIDLTSNVVEANVLGFLYGAIVSLPFAVIFFLLNRGRGVSLDEHFLFKWIVLFVVMLALIVVHELIHGFTWSRFTSKGFKAIEFGIIWKMLTPYCTCKEPLGRKAYLAGAIMPCIVLGVIPCIIAWFTHSLWLLFLGILMIMSAGGDLLICKMILGKKETGEALYLDHPTDVGLMMFEKK